MQVEYRSKSVVSAAGKFFCLFEEGDANNDDDGHKACGKEGKQNDHLKRLSLGQVVLVSAYSQLIFANVGSIFCLIYLLKEISTAEDAQIQGNEVAKNGVKNFGIVNISKLMMKDYGGCWLMPCFQCLACFLYLKNHLERPESRQSHLLGIMIIYGIEQALQLIVHVLISTRYPDILKTQMNWEV